MSSPAPTSPAPHEPELSRGAFILCFCALWALWFLFNLPATGMAFWWGDDYSGAILKDYEVLWQASLGAGRLAGVISFGAYEINQPGNDTINVLLRLIQGGMHCLAGTILITLLRRYLSLPGALFCGLLAVAWGFHGQSTLWWAAAIYTFAGFWSMLSVYLITREDARQRIFLNAAGALAAIFALNTSQASAMVAPIIFGVILVLRAIENKFEWRRALPEIAWIGASHCIGVVLTYLSTKVSGYQRTAELPSIADKIDYLGLLNARFWFFPDLYPTFIQVLHGLLILAFVGLVIYSIVRKKLSGLAIAGLILLPLTLALVPYLPVLVVKEDWPSYRIMYAAAFGLAGLAAIVWRLKTGRIAGMVFAVALILLNVAHLWVQHGFAKDLVTVVEKDFEKLEEIEAFAKEHDATQFVAVSPWTIGKPYTDDPHKLRYYYLGALRSDFFTPWTPPPYVYFNSDVLSPIWDATEAAEFAREHSQRNEVDELLYWPEQNAVVLIPYEG